MYFLLNFFRYVIYVIDFFLMTLFFLVVSFLPSALTKKFAPKLFRSWTLRFFRIFGVKEHIHEKFQKPLPKHFILISNHPSGIELLWLPSRFSIIPLSKEEISHWFILGRIIKSIGTVFVKRQDSESRHAAAEAILQAVNQGKNIMIFPEGGCYGKALNPFFRGAFNLSKESGVPILPVYVHYEEENIYEWGDYGLLKFMMRALFLPKNRNAHLYIFDAFYPDQFKDKNEYKTKVYEFYQHLEQKYRLA